MKRNSYSKGTYYNLRHIILCVSFALFANLSFAQRYPFHNLSVDDGLIQSQVTSITQDNSGNLWIGTLGGLSRYDGKNFTNYSVRNGLLNNEVRAVTADADGNIWIGGKAGLSRYNGKSFAHYTLSQQKMRGASPSQQILIGNDTVWWRAQADIYFITKGQIKNYPTPDPTGIATCIMIEQGDMWLAKGGTIYHRKNNRWDTLRFTVAADQRPPNTYQIFRGRDSILWLATNQGLYRIDSNRLQPHLINMQDMAYAPVISSIAQDGSGALWMGTNSGVIKLNGKNGQSYNKRNGLSDNIFSQMLTDAEGNIWMASDGQGIFRYQAHNLQGLMKLWDCRAPR